MNALALPTRGAALVQDIERMLGRGMSPVAIRRELERRGVRKRRAEKCIALTQRLWANQDFYEGPEGRMRRYRHIGEQTIDDVLQGKITSEQANAVAGLLRALKSLEAAPAGATPPEQPGAPGLVAAPPAAAIPANAIVQELQRRGGA